MRREAVYTKIRPEAGCKRLTQGGVMKHTAKDLADAIGASVEGNPSIELIGVAGPERAASADLIFVDEAKHASRAEASAAKCVILPPALTISGKTILRVENAKVAFARAAALLRDPTIIANGVHPTAVIAPLAKIAPSASIGPYAVIGEDAHIGEYTQIGAHCVIGAGSWVGDNCRIHPHVTLYANMRVGDRVEIHAGTVIGADGFGYAFGEGRHWKFPQAGIVEIGDDVEVGANATIDRGSLDDTRISEGVKLDNLVHVGHNVQIGTHTVIAAQTGISGSSVVGRNVIIGGQVGIADHCTLEDNSVAGAQAGIPTGKTIRSGQVVWGTPARALDKFKQQYAWFARLPELGARIKKLEGLVSKNGKS
jgi:UDP-3-O-[3-hydroxymyristoyl] glucosamine N-acyltransferase